MLTSVVAALRHCHITMKSSEELETAASAMIGVAENAKSSVKQLESAATLPGRGLVSTSSALILCDHGAALLKLALGEGSGIDPPSEAGYDLATSNALRHVFDSSLGLLETPLLYMNALSASLSPMTFAEGMGTFGNGLIA